MELPRRGKDDIYLADGAFTQKIAELREMTDAHDIAIGIVYAFDSRTHMLPFWYADRHMAPCSVRLLADVLDAAGFKNMRVVLQQWTPNLMPSRMELKGKPLDVLMVSAMQVHADQAYRYVRDAAAMGEQRPLILAGGPKAIYEPTDYFNIGNKPGDSADCVVTGEAFVMLELLQAVLEQRQPGGTMRTAFERARRIGTLDDIPGLVYLSPEAPIDKPVAINTGIQRLLRDLDEMPMPDAGYRMLEPPHRGKTCKAQPFRAKKVGKVSRIASVISTQGCRFNCSYCPIPAVNQRTWRYKSPKRLAAEIKHIYENFGIRDFFGTDDNFFNDRQTVINIMTELAATRTNGVKLSKRIRFYTEATEFDVFKNRDLLPLARAGGLRAIWFGIEDITAELVNKGQTAGKTADLFALLHKVGIQPMTMMIHSDSQPVRSKAGDLSGLTNQAKYLFDKGAVSYQCTYLGPAVGSRDFEDAAAAGTIYRSVNGKPIPQAYQDGNHVVASGHPKPWNQQMNLLRAYSSFYNPVNTVRALWNINKSSVGTKRVVFQIIGQIGLLLTIPRMLAWSRVLRSGRIEKYQGLDPAHSDAQPLERSGDELGHSVRSIAGQACRSDDGS